MSGAHDKAVNVKMLNPGDAGYEDGVDARQTLGPDWRMLVEKGVNTCLKN